MIIEKLWLRNYRNYEKEEIIFNPNMNLITGKNAQGKTNLLESLVYLSLTRSHRILEDSKLIKEGKEMAKIGCEVIDDKKKRLEVVLHPGGKTLFLNKQPIQRSSEFIGLLNVVLFSPDDLSLFNEAPRSRRKLIDQEITKINHKYLYSLNKYRTLLKNRNALLKNNTVDESYLDILDEQMIQEESIIIEERENFIKDINSYIKDIYQDLADEKSIVQIQYLSCIDTTKPKLEQLKQMYQNNRKRDKETHVSNEGIHREDIQFLMDGKEVINIASQGQKRMIILAFKLSLLHYIEKNKKNKPVLLLDDVLSELDKNRQEKLLKLIQKDYQCIITTTEKPTNINITNLTEYQVRNGKIEIVGGLR